MTIVPPSTPVENSWDTLKRLSGIKIAYGDEVKDAYWRCSVLPLLDDRNYTYMDFPFGNLDALGISPVNFSFFFNNTRAKFFHFIIA
jgi:hypothetical protein